MMKQTQIINENLLNYLFQLSRIEEEHDPARREKLIADLSKILDYFTQLQKVDTDGIESLAGGTREQNVWRDDAKITERDTDIKALRTQFSEKEQTNLKVPPVFE